MMRTRGKSATLRAWWRSLAASVSFDAIVYAAEDQQQLSISACTMEYREARPRRRQRSPAARSPWSRARPPTTLRGSARSAFFCAFVACSAASVFVMSGSTTSKVGV